MDKTDVLPILWSAIEFGFMSINTMETGLMEVKSKVEDLREFADELIGELAKAEQTQHSFPGNPSVQSVSNNQSQPAPDLTNLNSPTIIGGNLYHPLNFCNSLLLTINRASPTNLFTWSQTTKVSKSESLLVKPEHQCCLGTVGNLLS